MGEGYLIDTNVVIDYLENKLPEHSLKLIDDIQIQMSVITRMELLVWPKANQDQLDILTGFIDASKVFSLSEEVILKTIEIRKSYKIKLPDAIIAATAVIGNLSLITNNIRDFGRIEDLLITDPYK